MAARFLPGEIKGDECPKCDLVANGEGWNAVKDQLKGHMKSHHNVDERSIEGMLGDMKAKITGMFRR